MYVGISFIDAGIQRALHHQKVNKALNKEKK